MVESRSGQDRRQGWGPQVCEQHVALAVEVGGVKTTVRFWGSVVSVVIVLGMGIVGFYANRAIALAEVVTKADTALQLSQADRRVIHEELQRLEARIVRLERAEENRK